MTNADDNTVQIHVPISSALRVVLKANFELLKETLAWKDTSTVNAK